HKCEHNLMDDVERCKGCACWLTGSMKVYLDYSETVDDWRDHGETVQIGRGDTFLMY
uniref:Uncharacterized protein n=1 Tax=Oryza glaberrima TaxID=4538 RepID=I1Q992_ORYGL